MDDTASSNTTRPIAPRLVKVLMTGAFCHEREVFASQRGAGKTRVKVDVAVAAAGVTGAAVCPARGTPTGVGTAAGGRSDEDDVNIGVVTVGNGMAPGACGVVGD